MSTDINTLEASRKLAGDWFEDHQPVQREMVGVARIELKGFSSHNPLRRRRRRRRQKILVDQMMSPTCKMVVY